MNAQEVIYALKKLKNTEKAAVYQRFFKTGKGEYGEGDVFWGLTMPQQRAIAKRFLDLPLLKIEKLLHSEIHEYRMTALLILTYKYAKADKNMQKQIYDLYLKNTKYINNWDLVDVTTPKIIGAYLLDKQKNRNILYTFAKSKNVWKKRIAMLATSAFIYHHQFDDALSIAEILVHDVHDLIHKAVGWMLREIGKRDQKIEEQFLQKHYKTMPRTMLRYAIEKFPEKKRQFYLKT